MILAQRDRRSRDFGSLVASLEAKYGAADAEEEEDEVEDGGGSGKGRRGKKGSGSRKMLRDGSDMDTAGSPAKGRKKG
jgi:hypothetical protein